MSDYSIIIPAYNEEAYLPRTLKQLDRAISATPGKAEVIVVDNNCSDRTADIARQWGAKVVFEATNHISRARNAGAAVATGKYLVFLDADTDLSAELLGNAIDRLKSGGCCGGGTLVKFERAVPWLPQLFLDCWNWISVKLGLAAGCFVYCQKDAFREVGGFSEEVFASEEIWLSRALGAWGKSRNMSFEIITQWPISTSGRKVDWYSQTKLFLLFFPIMIFPPLVRVQSFCRAWYKRPGA